MKRLNIGRALLTVACILLLGAAFSGRTEAQVFNFSPGGFTNSNVCANSSTPAQGCLVLTNGSPNLPAVTGSGALRLNTAAQNQHASAWYYVSQPLNTGFTTAFQFTISSAGLCANCTTPGDGLALVIQGDPAGTGALGYTGNGQNISYGDNDVSGTNGVGNAILNSLAIELDTFQNSEYGDPDGNHIAVQSCGSSPLSPAPSPNSADHTYICPNGKPALLGLKSLPAGMSLSDGQTHTITVNYLPPGTCTASCNNFSVYLDSVLLLQTTVDITQQLILNPNGGAFIGFTSATGDAVENNDIVSWSFSQLPLSPITITQPIQTTTTTFNYTPTLSASVDYSQSGLPASAFTGVFMQGTVQAISDQDYTNLVNNTPFQGSTCLHQDLGNGVYACVTTTDLCTTSTNSTPAGANCPGTQTALIGTTNVFHADPSQKPIIAPGYIMGKDNAVSCGAAGDNTCKGLINIFDSITGDPTVSGKTKNFNSVLIPAQGIVGPSTTATTTPALNQGWTNQAVVVNLQSTEVAPPTNTNPPLSLPTVTGINYSVKSPNVATPVSGVITGPSGSFNVPATVEGATVVMFAATDSSSTAERVVTNSNGQVSTALPTLTINVDKTAPVISGLTISPAAPVFGQTVTASYSCSDGGSGVVLCGPAGTAQISPIANTGPLNSLADGSPGTHTFTVNAVDLAGNVTTASVTYTVTGGPQLSITPGSIAFGNVKIYSINARLITVKNTGTAPVNFSSVKLTQTESDGGPGREFVMLNLCGSKLAPQATCGVLIGFLADEIVSAAGTVTFTDNAQGGSQQVQITGNVVMKK